MNNFKVLLMVVASLAIAACSGGGSSGGTPTAAVKIDGTVAKGIIKNGDVTAEELSVSGAVLRTVGTAVTDATGNYALTISSSYAGGPIKLTLSAKSGGATLMACDVAVGCGGGILFGQDFPLPDTFKLVAYQLSAAAGTTVTAQITPFTNMAAARIEALNAASAPVAISDFNNVVASATSEISQLVGVDVSKTAPVDITNPVAVAAAGPDALQYAAFNAGLGSIAINNASGVSAGIDATATSFSGGLFDSATITSIVNAVAAESAATTVLNTTSLTAKLANITAIAASSVNGVYDPQPVSSVTLDAVAQARDLISQTRTWATQIAALKTPADAFGVDINTAQAVLNSTPKGLAGVFGNVIGGALHQVKILATTTGLQATTYSYPISYYASGVLVTGTGSVTVVNNGGTLNLNFSSNVGSANTSGTVTTNISSSILGTPLTSGLTLTGLKLTVTGSSLVSAASFMLTNAALTVTTNPTTINTATATPNELATLGFNGALSLAANGVTFTGTGIIKAVANNVATPKMPFSLSEFSVSGTFTGSKGSADASASLKFNNAATFDTIGFLSYRPTVWANNWQPNDPFGMTAAYATLTAGDTLQWGYYDQFSNQTCGQGSVNAFACVAGDPANIVTQVTTALSANYTSPAPSGMSNIYVSYYSGSGGGTAYSGMLTFPSFESASYWADATITVTSHVTLTGYPQAILTVSAHRSAYGTATNPVVGDVTAILSYNGQSVTFAASNTAATPTTGTGTLTISNPAGVHLVLTGTSGSPTGTISVGTTQVGTIDSSSGTPLAYFNDGTFQSLK